MSADASTGPDWDSLKAIGLRVEQLEDDGKLDKAAFDVAWNEAVEAVRGHDEFLEFLVLRAKPGWLNPAA